METPNDQKITCNNRRSDAVTIYMPTQLAERI